MGEESRFWLFCRVRRRPAQGPAARSAGAAGGWAVKPFAKRRFIRYNGEGPTRYPENEGEERIR